MDQHPKPTEMQPPDSPKDSANESQGDQTQICWTQWLRTNEPPGDVQPLPLPPPRDELDLEKLFSHLDEGLSYEGGDIEVGHHQQRQATDKRQSPDLLATEPKG
jgi:hypothetical protein